MKRRCLGCMEQYDDRFKVCPHCGYVVGTRAEEAIQMQPGTLLHDRYIIGKVLGSGGFGVTYLAWDGRLEQKVAVKEYLPGEFSTRMPGSSLVTVFNGDKGEQFRDGMKKLIEESKRLSKFQNEPGIVKIFDSFEENQTAYIVMEYLDGMTLASYLEHVGTIPEDEAVSMLMPVMASLQTVHEAGLLHRDIAPDNIFLTRTGEVKLIDFGAARYATTTHSRSLTVIIKPGYSPEEQYRSNGNQGAHTDVHALAATLYKMITGVRPADAMDRYSECETKGRDLLVPLHKFDKYISKNRENAILNGLNVRIEDRTADIVAFMDELNSQKPVKRRYGKIKRIDIYLWPLWVKILIPVVVAAIAVFGILLGTGVIHFDSFSIGRNAKIDGYATVPNVVRMSEKAAKKELEEAGFNYIVSGGTESEIIEKDTICTQLPNGGSYREIGTTIKSSISQGNGEVIEAKDGISVIPFFKGYDKEETIERFTKAGLIPVFEEVESDYEVGLICGIQDGYSEGQEVPEGTEIILKVSKGRPVEVPKVEGLPVDEAERILLKLGLDVECIYDNDDNVPENEVISQSAPPGEVLHKGDVVTLTVSSGEEMFVIPDVIGMPEYDAKEMIKNTVEVIKDYSSDYDEGEVIEIENYNIGDSVPKSKPVVIVVSLGNKPVKVMFDGNGGKSEYTEKEKFLDLSYGQMPGATRDGYTLLGWYTDKKSGKKINSDDIVEVDATHTLYAQWTPKEYTVTFDANGGSVTKTSQPVKYDSVYGALPTPKRSGHGFAGWYDSKTGGNKVVSSTTFSKTSNQTLYARWEANACTVTFNANGGKVSVQNASVSYGSPYGELPTPTRTGYDFKGWYTSSSGGTKVTSSTNVSNENNHTIYAQWEQKTFTVTFNADGGIVSTMSKSVTYGSTYGSLPVPTKDYYAFTNWYMEDGTLVTSSTIVDINKNITLYAHYTKNEPSGWTTYSSKYADTSKYEILDERWVYDYTQTSSGTEPQKSGWETYDSEWNGNWLDGYKEGENYKRQQVFSHYTYKKIYNYFRYSVNEIGGYSNYKKTSSHPNEYRYKRDEPLTWDSSRDGYNLYRYYYTNSNYFIVYNSSPYETEEIDKTIYKWQYQYKIYKYRKTEKDKVSENSDPTGRNGVSNVRYQIMYIKK